RHSFRQLERQFDAARADRVARDVESREDHIVDRDRTTLRLLLTSHCEERAHDARATLGGRANLDRGALRGRVALLLEKDRAGYHDRQRIVELVGDTGKE